VEESNNYETDHLNHDPAFCLAPGLFRSFPKGKRNDLFLDLTYDTPEAVYHFLGRYILGPMEMRVLQGIIALAAIGDEDGNKLLLSPDTSSETGLEHRRTLELKDAAIDKPALITNTAFYRLGKEIGYSITTYRSGHQVNRLRDSLERLWLASVITTNKATGVRAGSRLLSQYQNNRNGTFTVAINFQVAETILGINKRYTRLEMAEIRALKTDSARLIHQRLCGWIDPGKTKNIGLEALCEYVWFDQAFTPSTLRNRRQAVRKALTELESLDWTIKEYVDSKFAITRRGILN
jgi:hypothetical protein